jgi:CTP:molybdopterin cytidylyltransferase MocA
LKQDLNQVQTSVRSAVLSTNAETIQKDIRQYETNIVQNPDWNENMGSPIKIGLHSLQQLPIVDSIVIMLRDHLFVAAAMIDGLLTSCMKPLLVPTEGAVIVIPTNKLFQISVV